MQLLISPGYHSPELTHDFLQSLLGVIEPRQLWVLPVCMPFEPLVTSPKTLTFPAWQPPQLAQPLQIIAFSAGVVAAYPIALAWQALGGTSQMIAMDGWGMPLPGILRVYRVSHDRWTHDTTYFPSASESEGCFYADPGVDHLTLWQAPQLTQGQGSIDKPYQPMTAMEFIVTALRDCV